MQVSLTQLAKILGMHTGNIHRLWVKRYGLKAVKSGHRYLVDVADFWEWAEKNQHRFDSRKMRLGALGPEPQWMREKRSREWKTPDLIVPRQEKAKRAQWTTKEVRVLKQYMEHGHYTAKEIAQAFGRSVHSIQRKIYSIRAEQRRRGIV